MQDFIKCLLSLTVGGSVLAVCLLLLGRVKKLPKSFSITLGCWCFCGWLCLCRVI